MPAIILLIFIGVPIAEIAIFIQAGELIGLWPTLAVVVLTAVIGTALLRQQGLQTLGRVRESLERGAMPVGELFTGLCLLLAGVLLLTPGFLTDTIGFVLFVPAVQRLLGSWAMRAIAAHGDIFVNDRKVHESDFGPRRTPEGGGVVIDGDFAEVDESEPPKRQANDNRPTRKN